MLTWSTSTTSYNQNVRTNKSDSRQAEDLLKSWDDAVFDGKSTGDPEADREAQLWSKKFPHIRVVGKSCGEHKVMHPLPVTSPPPLKVTINHSKSADTFREKILINSKITLPKIVDSKISMKK